jgi:hypothetical protein
VVGAPTPTSDWREARRTPLPSRGASEYPTGRHRRKKVPGRPAPVSIQQGVKGPGWQCASRVPCHHRVNMPQVSVKKRRVVDRRCITGRRGLRRWCRCPRRRRDREWRRPRPALVHSYRRSEPRRRCRGSIGRPAWPPRVVSGNKVTGAAPDGEVGAAPEDNGPEPSGESGQVADKERGEAVPAGDHGKGG